MEYQIIVNMTVGRQRPYKILQLNALQSNAMITAINTSNKIKTQTGAVER